MNQRRNFDSRLFARGVSLRWPSQSAMEKSHFADTSLLLKRPATAADSAGDRMADKETFSHSQLVHNRNRARDDLIRMGPTAVRRVLQAQTRYSRKQHRDYAVLHSTGEENKIRNWAKLFNINLGKQVAVASCEGGMKWWHKSRRELVDEIVAAVACGQLGTSDEMVWYPDIAENDSANTFNTFKKRRLRKKTRAQDYVCQ